MIIYNKVVIQNLGDDTMMSVVSEGGQEETVWLGPNYPRRPSKDFDANEDISPSDLSDLSEILFAAYIRTVFARCQAIEGQETENDNGVRG